MFRARTTVVIAFLAVAVIVSIYTASHFFGSDEIPPLTNRHRDESIEIGIPPTRTADVQETLNEELEKVSAAWRRRERRTQSLYCKWKAETKWPAGTLGHPGPGNVMGPPEDATITETLEFSLNGNQMRFTHFGPKWNEKAAKFMPRVHLTLANDEANLRFFGGDGLGGKFNFPGASYSAPGRDSSSDHFHLMPLTLIFRPLDAQFGEALNLASVERVDSDASNGNLEGFLVKQVSAKGRWYPNYILWLDEDRDYVPIRVEARSQDHPKMVIEISYREDEGNIWTPESWSTTLYGTAQEIDVSTTGRVVQCVINPELTEKDFTFTLPGNTVVNDARTGEYHLLRPDGTKRHFTKEEMVPDVNYAAMVATESGEGVSPKFKALIGRIEALSEEPREMQLAIANDIKEYYNASQNAHATAFSARVAARQLIVSGDAQAAATVLRAISQSLGEGWEHISQRADHIEGSERLNNSVGKRFKVTGTTLNGDEFNLGAMRGKVVLVTFWHIGCRPCIEEFALLKRVYQSYHNDGFEIVGVTLDTDVDGIKEILNDRGVPWLNLYRDNDGQQPSIKYYGISTFPTNVLIGRDGKIVSVSDSVSNNISELRERVAELVAQHK